MAEKDWADNKVDELLHAWTAGKPPKAFRFYIAIGLREARQAGRDEFAPGTNGYEGIFNEGVKNGERGSRECFVLAITRLADKWRAARHDSWADELEATLLQVRSQASEPLLLAVKALRGVDMTPSCGSTILSCPWGCGASNYATHAQNCPRTLALEALEAWCADLKDQGKETR